MTFQSVVSKVGACIMYSQALEGSLLSGKSHIMQGHPMTRPDHCTYFFFFLQLKHFIVEKVGVAEVKMIHSYRKNV